MHSGVLLTGGAIWDGDSLGRRGHRPEECHGALSGHSLGQQSLARPGGAIKKQPGPPQSQREQLRVLQGELDGVQDRLLRVLQTTHILPLDRGHLR